jgi:hypothetical protein
MQKAFKQWNALSEEMGHKQFVEFLHKDIRVGDLKKAGFNVAGEQVDTVLPASVIFGPKIGGGFFPNLQGRWDLVTMDRWFMRTWGRVTGTLFKDQPELAQKHYDEFRANYAKNKAVVRKYFGAAPLKKDLTDELIDEMGQIILARWSREGFPDKTNPILRTSRAINIRLTPNEVPGTGKRRTFIRDTISALVTKLADDGIEMNAAAIQALIWYPEQRLWDRLGSRQTGRENDYAKAFRLVFAGEPGAPGPAGGGSAGAGGGKAGAKAVRQKGGKAGAADEGTGKEITIPPVKPGESFPERQMTLSDLKDVPGDPMRKTPEEMAEFTKKIQSGEIKPSIIIETKDGKPVRIKEGNHTLRALRELGIEDVTVRTQETGA